MNLENVVETKLTRTEVLDILIHEMSDDLQAAQKALQETVRALSAFTWEEVSHLFTHSNIKEISVFRYARNEDQLRIEVTVNLPLSSPKVGVDLRRHLQDLATAEKDENEACAQLRSIYGERGAIKAKLLRQMLSRSEDGCKLIEMLDGMKASARKQLALRAKGGGADGR